MSADISTEIFAFAGRGGYIFLGWLAKKHRGRAKWESNW
jgi:hypothetical protein